MRKAEEPLNTQVPYLAMSDKYQTVMNVIKSCIFQRIDVILSYYCC